MKRRIILVALILMICSIFFNKELILKNMKKITADFTTIGEEIDSPSTIRNENNDKSTPTSNTAGITVIYRDGRSGKIFADETHPNLRKGDYTPAFLSKNIRVGDVVDGYVFMGWSPTRKLLVSAGDMDQNGMIVYTATWKQYEESYTVVYTDGVKGEILFPDEGYEGMHLGDSTPVYRESNNELPTRENYIFTGWLLITNESEPTKYYPEVNPKISSDDADENYEIVYEAQWKIDPEFIINKLNITKEASNIHPVVGEEFTYTIKIENPYESELKVDASDILPNSLTFISASDGGIEKNGVVIWEDISVPREGSRNITLTVKANQATTIKNTATIHLNNSVKSSNTDIITSEEPKYTVIYKDEDNSFTEQRQENLPEGASTPKFKEYLDQTETLEDGTIIPIREGYRFVGWSKRINKVVSAEDANENYEIIYVANWQKMDTSTEQEETFPPQNINKDNYNENSNKIENPLTEDKIIQYLLSGTISLILIIIIILKNKLSNNKNLFF